MSGVSMLTQTDITFLTRKITYTHNDFKSNKVSGFIPAFWQQFKNSQAGLPDSPYPV